MNELLMQIEAEWNGPFGIAGAGPPLLADQSIAEEAGIYLFGFETENRFCGFWAGYTKRPFGQRLLEHLGGWLTGNYRILNVDAMEKLECKPEWHGSYFWNNWRRGLRGTNEFISDLDRLGPLTSRFISKLSVMLLPLSCETRLMQRLEAEIMSVLYETEGPKVFTEAGMRLNKRRSDETSVRVTLASDIPIIGMPTELEI